MPSLWTIAALLLAAGIVSAVLVRHFREQEVLARYEANARRRADDNDATQ